MRDRGLQGIETVVEWQQCVPSECDDHRLLSFAQRRGMRGLRPGLQIFDRRSFTPLRHCLGVDPQFPAQRRERSLRSLYCCSDGVRGRGAPVTYLSHMASFHSNERIAPSNRGIKHLVLAGGNQGVMSTAAEDTNIGARFKTSGHLLMKLWG